MGRCQGGEDDGRYGCRSVDRINGVGVDRAP
jgi:hypothetical protein